MVASTGVCETSDRRATVAIAVRYELAAAPADGEPAPPNAPNAPATATPATATTPAATQRPRLRRRPPPGSAATVPAGGSSAGRPGETVLLMTRSHRRE